jgi:soluble lytic murein transglycosylase-like protein
VRGAWAAVSNVFTAVPAQPAPPVPLPAAVDEGARFAARLRLQLRRRPARLVTACLATVLGPAVVAQAGAQPAADVRAAEEISQAAPVPAPVAGDPASWFPLARQAATTCPGLPSAVLVAIGQIESSMGLQSRTSSAGAAGPMQFLPSTWAAYGADGDGDGVSDLTNPVDAVYGAARLLCANGGADPARLPSALWNYNHSDDYVRQVISLARFIPSD